MDGEQEDSSLGQPKSLRCAERCDSMNSDSNSVGDVALLSTSIGPTSDQPSQCSGTISGSVFSCRRSLSVASSPTGDFGPPRDTRKDKLRHRKQRGRSRFKRISASRDFDVEVESSSSSSDSSLEAAAEQGGDEGDTTMSSDSALNDNRCRSLTPGAAFSLGQLHHQAQHHAHSAAAAAADQANSSELGQLPTAAKLVTLPEGFERQHAVVQSSRSEASYFVPMPLTPNSAHLSNSDQSTNARRIVRATRRLSRVDDIRRQSSVRNAIDGEVQSEKLLADGVKVSRGMDEISFTSDDDYMGELGSNPPAANQHSSMGTTPNEAPPTGATDDSVSSPDTNRKRTTSLTEPIMVVTGGSYLAPHSCTPSPTRVEQHKVHNCNVHRSQQCYSPSTQRPVRHNLAFSPSPSPTPSPRALGRCISPIAATRALPVLVGLKRKPFDSIAGDPFPVTSGVLLTTPKRLCLQSASVNSAQNQPVSFLASGGASGSSSPVNWPLLQQQRSASPRSPLVDNVRLQHAGLGAGQAAGVQRCFSPSSFGLGESDSEAATSADARTPTSTPVAGQCSPAAVSSPASFNVAHAAGAASNSNSNGANEYSFMLPPSRPGSVGPSGLGIAPMPTLQECTTVWADGIPAQSMLLPCIFVRASAPGAVGLSSEDRAPSQVLGTGFGAHPQSVQMDDSGAEQPGRV